MTSFLETKINKIFPKWPRGTVGAFSWLEGLGLYSDLIDSYKKTGRLKSFGHGAVIRHDDKVEWAGALYTLQEQLKLPVHLGARTALELKGFAHYVRFQETLFLFGSPSTKLPSWFRKHAWKEKIQWVQTQLFSDSLGFTEYSFGDFKIKISSPERAILEVLDFVPKLVAFEEAHLLYEGLTNLRPSLVQALLENCRSIKVKRLFLYFADLFQYSWSKKLTLKPINLGKGKRQIYIGGRLDPKYLITVPEASNGS